MPGPPSQAGRFKPRKPAKKIRVGASATTAAAAAGPTASSSSTRRKPPASGRGRGGRGRGRGRGGPRAPAPSGAVFFTGNAPAADESKSTKKASSKAATASSSTRAATTKSTKTKKAVTRKEAPTEEIVVGELDVAIGTSAPAARPKEEPEDDEPVQVLERAEKDANLKIESLMDTYDSDSSEEVPSRGDGPSASIPPTELPFPVPALPVGIGGSQRPVLYTCQQPEESNNEKYEPVFMEQQQDTPLVSPFCDRRDAKLRAQEEDSWFIFQFPTRLPALQTTPVPNPVKSEESLSVVSSMVPDTPQSTAADVATPSTVSNSFDNALSRAPAGRLGKLLVYKSGKTVLVMGGENGTPEIRMNVAEGLPCGFVQHAVAIDTEENTYIPLGDVKKTVVVTPDVDSAFSSS